jgi:hypothetical protein
LLQLALLRKDKIIGGNFGGYIPTQTINPLI